MLIFFHLVPINYNWSRDLAKTWGKKKRKTGKQAQFVFVVFLTRAII